MQELSSLGRSAVRACFYSLPTSPREIRRQRTRGRKRKEGKRVGKKIEDVEKSETRGRTGRAIRSRAGCAQLEEKLEICGSRWVGGEEDRGETAPEYRRARRISLPPSPLPPLSRFLLPLFLRYRKKESLTASDNLASRRSPRRPVAWPHTDCPGVMTRPFLR